MNNCEECKSCPIKVLCDKVDTIIDETLSFDDIHDILMAIYEKGRQDAIEEMYNEIIYIENNFRSMVNNINQEDDLIKWIDLNGKLTAITIIKHLIGDKLKENKNDAP